MTTYDLPTVRLSGLSIISSSKTKNLFKPNHLVFSEKSKKKVDRPFLGE
jgi:hypothetical protein